MSNEQPETVDINTKEELNGQHIVIGMIIRQALCFMAMMSACHQIQYDIERRMMIIRINRLLEQRNENNT